MDKREKKTPERYIDVEVMRCRHCPRLTVVLGNKDGGRRLTGHKCAGAWNSVTRFTLPVSAFRADVDEALRVYGYLKNADASAKKASGTH